MKTYNTLKQFTYSAEATTRSEQDLISGHMP